MIGKSQARKIMNAIIRESHIGDLVLLTALGYATVPLTKFLRSIRKPNQSEASWLRSPSFRIARAFSQLSAIGGIVYLVDWVAVALKEIGFNFPLKMNLPTIVAQCGFTMWLAVNTSAAKQAVLCRVLKVRSPEDLGRASIYDRLGDGIIYFTAILVILDILCVETGRAMGSVFALGSIGTLVLSLASKDLAADFISGIALSAADKFHEGEEVRIGTEYIGIVQRVGWMNTDIRGYDEIISRIPNSQVANQKVQNISRIGRSQVKQWIYFDFKDIDKIPAVIQDIKVEIARSCPKLVVDGSRPFWCHWREFKQEKLEVVVDTHFTIRHGNTEYFDTKQKVLEAIARAAKKNDIRFALPVLSIRNEPGSLSPANEALRIFEAQDQTFKNGGDFSAGDNMFS
jgi:small-conductance mechanosensitive channel